jgi:predicted nucleotidyltransferase
MSAEVQQVLTPHQREVAARVLAEEGAHRRHLVVSLSGAHAYGFPSPDSDLDVKAVHLDPTESLLGFPRPMRASERLEVVDGVEVDYSSNELGGVLLGVLKGNGNFIERFLSGFTFESDPVLASLQPLVRESLSKRVHRHYAGFAAQQRQEWERTGRTSAKKLLYVLRTTLTGTHMLLTGEVVTDVTRLLERYGFAEALELVQQKRRGEKSELPAEMVRRWEARVPSAFERLDRALVESHLPDVPANEAALDAWLIHQRLALLEARR